MDAITGLERKGYTSRCSEVLVFVSRESVAGISLASYTVESRMKILLAGATGFPCGYLGIDLLQSGHQFQV